MASDTSITKDNVGNTVFRVDGQVVDVTTYERLVTKPAALRARLGGYGWTNSQIEQYVAQEFDPDYDVFDWEPDDLDEGDDWEDFVIGPGPGFEALFQSEYDELIEEIEAANDQARRESEAQEIANEENDWRVRLHLGILADYLYLSDEPGILAPLAKTDGIIFPYTPEIAIQYNADYENYDLVHSNYRGYFYRGSQVQNIIVTATFTANDVHEANYLLASLHFLRSCTKMFYGQDDKRGMPPPVVFLTGLGEYQFDNHPCAITMMNYNLPNDVDYIPCGKPKGVKPQVNVTPYSPSSTKESRRKAAQLAAGAEPVAEVGPPEPTKVYGKATYVPTKITINFTMIPIQTRDQISNEFSLKDYANGKLLKKGFW